jgi:hypothetical protein
MEITEKNIKKLTAEIVQRTSGVVSKQYVRNKLKKDYETISQKEFDEEWEFVFGKTKYTPG